MILSHSKKFIFIHVYKAAGSSIRQVLRPYDEVSSKDFPWYKNLQFKIGLYFKPLSTWSTNHITSAELRNHLKPEVFNNYFKFCFVRNPWDWQVSLYHFMLQNSKHRQHKLISNIDSFDKYIEWRVNEDLELQKEFICGPNNEILVDFIGKFENLQEDFNKICDRINVPRTEIPFRNKSEHRHYREYYNKHTIDLVAKAYKEDIELLKYEF